MVKRIRRRTLLQTTSFRLFGVVLERLGFVPPCVFLAPLRRGLPPRGVVVCDLFHLCRWVCLKGGLARFELGHPPFSFVWALVRVMGAIAGPPILDNRASMGSATVPWALVPEKKIPAKLQPFGGLCCPVLGPVVVLALQGPFRRFPFLRLFAFRPLRLER